MISEGLTGNATGIDEWRDQPDENHIWTENRRNIGGKSGRRNITEIKWYDRWEQ